MLVVWYLQGEMRRCSRPSRPSWSTLSRKKRRPTSTMMEDDKTTPTTANCLVKEISKWWVRSSAFVCLWQKISIWYFAGITRLFKTRMNPHGLGKTSHIVLWRRTESYMYCCCSGLCSALFVSQFVRVNCVFGRLWLSSGPFQVSWLLFSDQLTTIPKKKGIFKYDQVNLGKVLKSSSFF